jgi:mono/diheme cytochrome c family protein
VAVLVAVVVVGAVARAEEAQGARRPHRQDGAVLYSIHCAHCHGASGRGDGPDADLFVTQPRDLHGGCLGRYAVTELVDRIRNGTRLNLAVDPAAIRARAAETEAVARYVEHLPHVNWRLVERGQELFVDRCEICHGPFGRPMNVHPPGVSTPADLSADDLQRRVGDDDVAETIRRGHGSMPGLVPRIDATDVPAVVAFVRLLSPGYECYSRYCAACHGDDGRGPGVRFSDDGVRAPTVVFDAAFIAKRDPEHLRAAVWHMSDEQRPEMPHLRDTLSAAEARAIIEYLKRLDEP